MAQPAPGGPVLTRTVEDTQKANVREISLAKAAEFERLAYEVTDPVARDGYLAKASELRKAA
jgi:alkyl sulfatase BDS1-like metallo-beta-lactamase superfamily hydrolase